MNSYFFARIISLSSVPIGVCGHLSARITSRRGRWWRRCRRRERQRRKARLSVVVRESIDRCLFHACGMLEALVLCPLRERESRRQRLAQRRSKGGRGKGGRRRRTRPPNYSPSGSPPGITRALARGKERDQ